MSTLIEFSSAQLDPLSSATIREELPGAQAAFDADAMRGYLQAALFGAGYTIERCEPGQSVYTGESCIVRYPLEVNDSLSGQVIKPLVVGRVFPDQPTAAQYLRDKLAPL